MCGLCGEITFDGTTADTTAVARMVEALVPRGPDGQGSWSNGRIGMSGPSYMGISQIFALLPTYLREMGVAELVPRPGHTDEMGKLEQLLHLKALLMDYLLEEGCNLGAACMEASYTQDSSIWGICKEVEH